MFSGETYTQGPPSTGKKMHGMPMKKESGFALGWDNNNQMNDFQLRKSKNKEVTGKVTTQAIINRQEVIPQRNPYEPQAKDFERIFNENPNMSADELEKLMHQYESYRQTPPAPQRQPQSRHSENYSIPESDRRVPIRPRESMKDILYNGVGVGEVNGNTKGSRVWVDLSSEIIITQDLKGIIITKETDLHSHHIPSTINSIYHFIHDVHQRSLLTKLSIIMLVFTVIPLLLSTFVSEACFNSTLCYSNYNTEMGQQVGKWHAVRIHEHLNKKYDTHFNFFLTKTTNEIIYNHVLCPNFIDFKDQIIFADNNQYLKRYYFLVNAQEKSEIFDRINLLAEFYGNAVLLRYQYPLMVLTKTKSIFLKRIKRLKKYLVEEGSSDQSNSQRNQDVVSLHSSCFLRTISSSQLERKSMDDRNHLELDFSMFKEDQPQIHDIFAPEEDENEEEQISNTALLANITKFTKELSYELVLQKQQIQDDVSHLMMDFDEFDREDVMRKYHKIIQKQNREGTNNGRMSLGGRQVSKKEVSMKGSKHLPAQTNKIRQLIEKKPMASSITITALEDQHYSSQKHGHPSPHQQQQDFTHKYDRSNKKSMMSPRITEQRQNKQNYASPQIKRSTFYQYQLEHNNFPLSNQMVIAEDQMEDSPHKHFYKREHDYQPQSPTFNSGKQHYLQKRGYTSRDRISNQDGIQPRVKYSSILKKQSRFKNLQIEPDSSGRNRPFSLRQPQDYVKEQPYPMYDRYGNGNPNLPSSPQNRMTSINININNLEQKKQQLHKINVKYNPKSKGQQTDRNFRAEKKRKIRQKAAALLNRVKSQDYMRPLEDYSQQYSPRYYDQYYH